jgi:hypothetical protein
MTTFYVYLWLREKEGTFPVGTPYYVGKGKGRRAFTRSRRPPYPPKDRSCIIIIECPSEEAAFAYEKLLISCYGRIDLGTGCLHNMTEGGDGTRGYVYTDKAKKTIQDGVLRSLKDPKVLASHIATLQQYRPTPEVASERMSELWKNPKWKENQIEAIQRGLDNPEVKIRLSNAHKGPWSLEKRKKFKNSPLVQKHIQQLHEDFPRMFWDDPNMKEQTINKISYTNSKQAKLFSEQSKKRWEDLNYKKSTSKSIKAAKSTPEAKKAASEKAKAAWKIRKEKQARSSE